MEKEIISSELPFSWVKCVTNEGKMCYKHGNDNVHLWERSKQEYSKSKQEYNITNNGKFNWSINGNQYDKMIQSKVGQNCQSRIFQIANLKWRIVSCPNGVVEQQEDSFRIYIHLLNIPREWQSLLVQWKIKCIQTNGSVTHVATYDQQHHHWGWGNRNLLLSELKELRLNKLNFLISLRIIKITSNEIIYFNPIQIKTEETIKWDINKNLLKQFNDAYYGKAFESAINNNCILVIQCFPKGEKQNDTGYVSIFLALINLPFQNILKIKIECILSCVENHIKCRFTDVFSVGQSSGISRFCKYNKLYDSPNKLTLTAHYKILSIYA
eukprot:388944_1